MNSIRRAIKYGKVWYVIRRLVLLNIIQITSFALFLISFIHASNILDFIIYSLASASVVIIVLGLANDEVMVGRFYGFKRHINQHFGDYKWLVEARNTISIFRHLKSDLNRTQRYFIESGFCFSGIAILYELSLNHNSPFDELHAVCSDLGEEDATALLESHDDLIFVSSRYSGKRWKMSEYYHRRHYIQYYK